MTHASTSLRATPPNPNAVCARPAHSDARRVKRQMAITMRIRLATPVALSGIVAPRLRDLQGAHLPIQVGPLDAKRLGGLRNAPAVLLQDGGDVLVLEACARLPQRAASVQG